MTETNDVKGTVEAPPTTDASAATTESEVQRTATNPPEADAGGARSPESSAPTSAPPQEENLPPASEATALPQEADALEAASASSPTSEQETPGARTAGEEAAPSGGPAPPDGQDGAPARKKRRRRRRKKKGAEAQGNAQAPEPGAESHESEASKKQNEAPLARFFEGHGREHLFRKDDIVAGRLLEVREDGVAVIDLFGRGLAFMDTREPEEIAELPEPAMPEAASAASEAPPEAPAAAEAEPSPASPDAAEPSEPPTQERSAEEASAASEAPPEAPPEAPAVAEADAAEVEPSPASPDAAEPSEPPTQERSAEEDEAPGPPPDTLLLETPRHFELDEVVSARVRSVSDSGSVALVNRPIDRKAAKAALRAARERGEKVEGIVFGYNRGGFDVLVQGIRAFCPASGMSLQPIEDPQAFVGRKFLFSVAPKKRGSSIVVSRRSALEKERRRRIKERLTTLQPGERLTGVVRHVRSFGLIVDVGDGVEGLVHLSELSWKRGVSPSEVAEVGQQVQVQVLEAVPPSRKERYGKLSLSIRATLPDPWEDHPEVLREGLLLERPVVRVTDFGAFVALAEGVDGLLPASEILGSSKNGHPSDVLKEGDSVRVVVERVDRKGHKIWLSKPTELELKWLEEGVLDPDKRPKSLKPGQHIPVLVVRAEHGGVVVQAQGVLGARGRGFVPNRELAGEDGPIDRKSLQPGTELMVKIIGTDRSGGLRCSMRARLIDEERRAVREYRKEASRQGFGTFGDLLRAKLGQISDGEPGS